MWEVLHVQKVEIQILPIERNISFTCTIKVHTTDITHHTENMVT